MMHQADDPVVGTDKPATEPRERGRQAIHPRQFGFRAWRDVLWRVWRELGEDNLGLIAAGVAFYSLLALFPFIAAIISLWGLIADTQILLGTLDLVENVFSPSVASVFSEQLVQLTAVERTQLGWGTAIGFAIALWSARRGMAATITALNVVYDESESRAWWKVTAISLLLTIGAVIYLLFTLGTVMFAASLPELMAANPILARVFQGVVWIAVAASFAIALAILFRYAPSRSQPQWQWVSHGAVFATLTWAASSIAFSVYLENFASYDETYGTLGGVIALLMWFLMSAYVSLLAAELNAELEHQTERDTTTGEEQPMGERGAFVADTLGAGPDEPGLEKANETKKAPDSLAQASPSD